MRVFVKFVDGKTEEFDVSENIIFNDFVRKIGDVVIIEINHIVKLFKGKLELTKDNFNEVLEDEITISCFIEDYNNLKKNNEDLMFETLSTFYFIFKYSEGLYDDLIKFYPDKFEIIKKIILNINNYKKCDEKKNTLLMLEAQCSENTEISKMLIENGIDVNSQNINGETALMLASKKGWYFGTDKIFKILMDAGSDINLQDNNGDTALLIAVKYHQDDNVRILTKFGADVNLKNNFGETALTIAKKESNNDKIIELLMKANMNN